MRGKKNKLKREPKITDNSGSELHKYEEEFQNGIGENVSSYLDDKEYYKRSRTQQAAPSAERAAKRSPASAGSRIKAVSPDGEYEKSAQRETRREASRASSQTPGQTQAKKKKKKKHSAGRFIGKLVGICAALVLVLAILVCIPATRPWAVSLILRSPLGTLGANIYLGDEYNSNVLDTDFDSSLIETNSGVSTSSLYYTFALLGVDARDEELESGSRTDTMVVVSVNRLTGSIRMASIARDTYVYMSCDGESRYAKANAAYTYWGAEGTISMLNQNFDLDIDDYVVVNFSGLTTIVDLLGGITIEVTEAELSYLNQYVNNLSDIDGVDYAELTETGLVTLTGAQATAYCRIRYTNFISPEDGTTYSGDWGRTARQRYVLTTLLSQLKTTGATTLVSAAKTVCAENTGDDQFIISSMSLGQLTSLAGMCYIGDIDESSSFPVSGEYYSMSLSVGDSVIPDTLEENAALLHEFLYNDEDYSVSSELSQIASSTRSTLN